jgi:hypothetical protein
VIFFPIVKDNQFLGSIFTHNRKMTTSLF